MNKKVLVVLMVLVLAVAGLSAKGNIKAGVQLGWGFDTGSLKCLIQDVNAKFEAKNNGFAFALTGEYAFDKNWSVKANLGMMFAGKTTLVESDGKTSADLKSEKEAGPYFDVAIDAKYTYAINKQISVAGLAGLELVSGQLLKDLDYILESSLRNSSFEDSNFYNVAFGVNLGVEGAYQLTNEVAITAGFSGAILFVNSFSSSEMATFLTGYGEKPSIISFYLRPYVGATYAF